MIPQETLQATLDWLHLMSTVLMVLCVGNGFLVFFLTQRLHKRALVFVGRCAQNTEYAGFERGVSNLLQSAALLFSWGAILRALIFTIVIVWGWMATLFALQQAWVMVIVWSVLAVFWFGTHKFLTIWQRARWADLDVVTGLKRGFVYQFDNRKAKSNRLERSICTLILGGVILVALIKLFDLR